MTLEFELTINTAEPPPAGSNVTVRYSKGMRQGRFSLAGIDEIVAAMQDALHAGRFDGPWMEQAGAELFDALFTGQVLDAWRECRTLAASQKTGVRLRLYTDQPELMAVPWEYLRDRQHERWLALDTGVSLVRGLPLSAREAQPVEALLRVLVMISSPTDLAGQGLDELDSEREWENLDEAAAGAAVELIRIQPTYAALQEALRQHKPHLLHFIGHGISDDQGYLLLCDAEGAGEWVGADRLAPLLAAAPSLAMIFLNACQGAAPGSGSAFSGLAQQLLQQQLPAVLAMQAPIADTNALAFSREFYRALADGVGVEGAVNEGRLAISGQGQGQSYGWGVPACYFQSGEPFALPALTPQEKAGRLWQKAQKAPAERANALVGKILALDPTHAGAGEMEKRGQREGEAAPLYAAAQAYIQSEKWRDAHRSLSQIEGLVANYRQTRNLLAQVLGRLGGEAPATSEQQSAQVVQYRSILTALQEGRLVPFLGWGAGRVGRPAGDSWLRDHYLPDAAESAADLAGRLAVNLEERLSLPQVSQYTSLLDGDEALYERLSDLYRGDYQPTLLHRLLAEIPGRLAHKGYPTGSRRFVIFSAAFDNLLERAYDEVGQPYHLFAYRRPFEDDFGVAQPARFLHRQPDGQEQEVDSPNDYPGLDGDRHPVIVKLCGRAISAQTDSVLVTEDQYLTHLPSQEFGALLPAKLLQDVKGMKFLFFGYSLQPWHLRLLWQRMSYQGRRLHGPSWAFIDAQNLIEERFWATHNVTPIVAQPEGVVAYVNEWLQNLEARR